MLIQQAVNVLSGFFENLLHSTVSGVFGTGVLQFVEHPLQLLIKGLILAQAFNVFQVFFVVDFVIDDGFERGNILRVFLGAELCRCLLNAGKQTQGQNGNK